MNFNLFRFLLLLSLASLCPVSRAQAPHTEIAGRVVRADNGLPIEGATVMALTRGPTLGGYIPTETTDSDGRYRFGRDLGPGEYIMKATADGFIYQTYIRDSGPEGYFLRVDASASFHGIDFQLKREAVIRGQLVGADGQPPAAGIHVAAVHLVTRPDAAPRPLTTDWAKSGVDGSFVIPKLPAGVYYVCVSGPDGYNDFPVAGGWYRETWFGDSHSLTGATPLPLKEGDTRDDIRITVERQQRFRVIVWPSGPGNLENLGYRLIIAGRTHKGRRQADGSHVMLAIPPGHYNLIVLALSGRDYVGESEMPFEVTDSDVTLHIHAGGPGSVKGRIKIARPSRKIPPGLMIELYSREISLPAETADPAGRFRFASVPPGQYHFGLLKQPDGIAILSVQCAGKLVTREAPLQIHDRQRVSGCKVLIGPKSP